MNVFKIIGESKPNKIKLVSEINHSITELPKRVARKLADKGVIQIKNPELLYPNL